MVGIQLHGFEHIEKQRLSHDVQIVAERIEYLHAMLRLVRGETLVISRFRQRIGHDLRKAVSRQEIGGEVHQLVPVGFRRVGERRIDVRGNRDVIVAVDAENLLDQIGLARHIDPIGRHGHAP